AGHASTLVTGGGHYDAIISTEDFMTGMQKVMQNIETKHSLDLTTMPRFNESEGHGPKRMHLVEDYFDDLSLHLVNEIYHKDFELFKYDRDNPANKMPIGEIDLAEVRAKLKD
ncbi:MAG TPA: hypothetical protein DD416_10240, partial [Rhodobacteraceae bacterium]|nr:hypothetical protein [Paracoccaceae bacterium]